MNAVESAWQELLTSALLGTERHSPVLPPASGKLPGFLAGLDSSDPQLFLLSASAVLALYRQAGRLPVRLPAQTLAANALACEPDELVQCAPAAATRLAAMLGGLNKDLVPEWLQLATSVQKRAPDELLPDLLAWGETHPDQIELLLPVIGKRGRWLAGQIPSYEKVRSIVTAEEAAGHAIPELWQTESQSIRELLLRRTRRSNPSAALQLVQSTWQEDGAEERTAFLKIFAEGLNMADEPFLETALDNRAKGVRAAAADLLTRLPASRLVQRQTERALALVHFKPGSFLRKDQIVVTLPEACDVSMVRDGVQPKRSVGDGLGEKADWLEQILSVVPPSTWSQKWGKTPSELLDIAADGEWQELLHTGWVAAAGRHADPEWAEAILKLNPRRSLLFNAIPAQRRAVFLQSQLQSRLKEGMELLFADPDPWGMELSRLCVQHLRNYYLKSSDISWQYSFNIVLRSAGRRMDPALFTEAAQKLPGKDEPDSAWEKAVESLLQTLDFRRQMREELMNA